MTKWCLIQVNELWTWSDTIKNQTNPYMPALLWNTRNLWNRMRCPHCGECWYTQLGEQWPRATSHSQRDPQWGGLAPHRLQQPPPSSTCRALCPCREGCGRTGSCFARAHRTGAAVPTGTLLYGEDPHPPQGPQGSLQMQQCSKHCTAAYCAWPVFPPPKFTLTSLLLNFIYFKTAYCKACQNSHTALLQIF